MGYGLTDVQSEDYSINDPRFNEESVVFYENEDNFSIDDYFEFLKKKAEEDKANNAHSTYFDIFMKDNAQRNYEIYNGYSYNGEYGLDNVIVFRPITMSSWERYDDPIDYVMETYSDKNNSQINHVTVFDRPLYPFENYMNCHTGEKIKDAHRYMFHLRNETKSDELIQWALNNLGFDDVETALNTIVPWVPESVTALLEYGKVFKDPDTWKQLRPMVYTYWG